MYRIIGVKQYRMAMVRGEYQPCGTEIDETRACGMKLDGDSISTPEAQVYKIVLTGEERI